MNRSLLKTAAAALGLTTIGLAWIGEPLVDPKHSAVYHWSGQSIDLFAPVFLDVLIVWTVLTLVLLAVRTPGIWRVAVWSAIILFTPSVTLKTLAFLAIARPSHLLTLALAITATVIFLAIILLWRPGYTEKFERVVGFASTVLAFVAITGTVLLCQLAWFGWQARSLNRPSASRPARVASTAAKPRIIWILFDELSYQQLYEHRFSGLHLPAFDAFAAQSTVFTHTIPASLPVDQNVRTEKIVPSLLTGIPVDATRSSAAGQLSMHDPETHSWQHFDERNTVFQDADNAGYNTAVVGWYNPYCRIMPTVLDECFWRYGLGVQNGMVPDGTVASNMLKPADVLAETATLQRFLRPLLGYPGKYMQDGATHIDDYRKLRDVADSVLADASDDFVLIHFALPHPGGIYNRTTGQLTTGPSSYIDNLALADKYLGHVRSMLTQRGQWDSSTIVVMGDHGWRMAIWRYLPDWTREDENASMGGRFDDRPAYIVKLPGQQTRLDIDAPFRALETRKLLDALIAHKVGSKEDLSAWVQQVH